MKVSAKQHKEKSAKNKLFTLKPYRLHLSRIHVLVLEYKPLIQGVQEGSSR